MRELHSHPYTVSDLQRIIDFRGACTTPENSNDYPTVVDLQESLSSPSSDIVASLWEDENNSIMAYAIVALNFCNLYFLMHPEVQSEELATDIINWGMEQLREHGECTALDTPCRDTDTQRASLLEQCGFTCSEIQTLHMTRSLGNTITIPDFPQGFTLRHVRGKDEVEDIVALHRAAFGTENMTVEHRVAIMNNSAYMKELDLLLVAPNGMLAAFCYCTIPQEANRQHERNEGEIAIVGTHPTYRNHGIGRAMLLAGLQNLKEHDIEVATLGTSSDNVQAQSIFYEAGFRVSYRSLWYSKEM